MIENDAWLPLRVFERLATYCLKVMGLVRKLLVGCGKLLLLLVALLLFLLFNGTGTTLPGWW